MPVPTHIVTMSFYFEGGPQSFVRHLNRNKEVLHTRPIYVERSEGTTAVEVALQYNDGVHGERARRSPTTSTPSMVGTARHRGSGPL